MNVKYLIKFISIFIIFLSYPFNLHSKLSDEEISLLVDNMSVKELLGQKFIIGPPWILPEDSNYSKYEDNDINSRSILDELIFDLKIGNFYISKSNYLDWMSYINDNRCLFSSVSDYPRMNYGIISYEINSILSKMHSSSNGKVEPLIFTDLEGGRVQGIRGGDIPETASPMSLSTTRNLSIIQSHSNAIAEMLSNLNITTNFAPVVDINYEGYQSLIGTRAFGSDGKLVKPAARAFILGQLQGGGGPCA